MVYVKFDNKLYKFVGFEEGFVKVKDLLLNSIEYLNVDDIDILTSIHLPNLDVINTKEKTPKTFNVRIYNHYNLPLPKRKTPQSACFDVYTPTSVFIEKGSVAKIDTGLIIESPPGWHYEVSLRSGLASKGLVLNVGVGTIDGDYCGDGDYLLLFITNVGYDGTFEIENKSRVVQIEFRKDCPDIVWEVQNSPNFCKDKARGGFGSTGNK